VPAVGQVDDVVELTFGAIPHVLDDDEVPFVMRFDADRRRYLQVGETEYRRGNDRCIIAWPFGSLRLQALVTEQSGNTYLLASAGPIFNEWWPLLQREGSNRTRPLLSAAAVKRPLTFTGSGLSIDVVITPPTQDFNVVSALVGFEGRLGDQTLLLAHAESLGVIKAALLLLGEYRSLVDPVPDVHAVQEGGARLPLSMVLDVAQEAAKAIAWKHS
jgi:hypothetical protein